MTRFNFRARDAVFASAIGVFVSLLLLGTMAISSGGVHDASSFLQILGILAGAALWGVHSGGNAFTLVMVCVNAAVYSLIILVFLILFGRP